MEVAGVVIGIVPLIVNALKSYRTAYEKFKAFRNWAREISHVQKRFRIQRKLFENESRLLLRPFLQCEQQVDVMLDTHIETSESSTMLEQRLNRHLGCSYQCFQEIIEEILENIHDIENDLDTFQINNQVPGIVETAKRKAATLRNALVVSFEKSVYLKKLRNLADLCDNLRTLRQQLSEYDTASNSLVSTDRTKRGKLPPCFQTIREASATLHDAFAHTWPRSCKEQTHSQHKTILCLDAKVEDHVRLDLAVSYEPILNDQQRRFLMNEPPIWLYVCSTTARQAQLQIMGKRKLDSGSEKHVSSMSTGDCQGLCADPLSLQSQDLRRESSQTDRYLALDLEKARETSKPESFPAKRLKIDASINASYSTTKCANPIEVQDEAEPQSQPDSARDLRQMENICQHLKHHICKSQSEERCLGFLQSTKPFRHFLYSAATDRPKSVGIAQQATTSLGEIIGDTSGILMTLPQQLQVAHKLAIAVLQYQSTPWLKPEWELGDVGLFLGEDEITDSTFATLHLSAHFLSQDDCHKTTESLITSAADVNMESVADRSSRASLSTHTCSKFCPCNIDPQTHQALLYGVRNTTLCSLGIALLQISHRKTLEELRRHDDPNNIFTARRLAAGANPLGLKFQKIVRKCLGCDFGSGTDMQDKELQDAVFADVVCELEAMVQTLTI
ncbi:MAG: hypothetical protein M1820_008527 [Bogoriella megaspora]|nr:MAG: hypothetical protein M1820_008527 [Bogoriella megaspora]